jgi:hypothetical protein
MVANKKRTCVKALIIMDVVTELLARAASGFKVM